MSCVRTHGASAGRRREIEKPRGSIRKYGSTFYIGIAMVVLPYFGLWEN